MFSNTSSTDLIKLSVNYFTVHYLLVNSQIGLLYIDKLTLIWVSTTYCNFVSCQKISDMRLCTSNNSAKQCRLNICTVINDNAHFYWMIVVRNGQVFKYCS